jgi:hypothetical protein
VSYQQEYLGYIWLTVVGLGYLVRLLIDSMMVRRPLLEPNLSIDGLVFTGAALLFFLTFLVMLYLVSGEFPMTSPFNLLKPNI